MKSKKLTKAAMHDAISEDGTLLPNSQVLFAIWTI